jgi:hypothetical protein
MECDIGSGLSSRVYGGREDGVTGSLEARRVAEGDWTKPSSSIYFLVAPHGGFRPAQWRRSRLALTLAEREVISRGVTTHHTARSIAKLLGRSPSTVSREHPQRKVLEHEPRIGSMVLAVLPLQSFSILASIGREGDSIFYDALLILPTLVFQSFDRPLSADQIRVNHQSQDQGIGLG